MAEPSLQRTRAPSKQTSLARLGEQWAEQRADDLRGDLPAIEWPDEWPVDWSGDIPEADRLSHDELSEQLDIAVYAAQRRWAELVTEQRDIEATADSERDDEAGALSLLVRIRSDLPDGVEVDHDGPRLFLRESRRGGRERTVTSLEEAWRVLREWGESIE